MPKYLLLMRHANHKSGVLTNEGRESAEAVANRFKEVLEEFGVTSALSENISFDIDSVMYASTSEVIATRYILHKTLQYNAVEKKDERLNPENFHPYINSEQKKTLIEDIKCRLHDMKNNKALVIVGHQPFLGWLAREVSGKSLPISQSELLCIVFDNPQAYYWNNGYLRWVLSPRDDKALEEIKEKIKYKMEIAKLLSVFITTALGFLLSTLIDPDSMGDLAEVRWALIGAIVAFIGGIVLYLMTMYSYDRLLMPSRFWADSTPPQPVSARPKWLVWRPPSSAVWVLYQNMMRIWRYFFTGATISVLVGLVLLSWAALKVQCIELPIVIVICFIIASWWFYRVFRPQLGTQD